MARRVPVSDPRLAIQAIEESGGVILTGFSSMADVERVNRDAQPFISAIVEDVSNFLLAFLNQSNQELKE